MFKFKHIFVAVFMILQFLSSCSLLTNEQVKETEKQTIDFLPLLSNKAANGRTDATLVVELDTKQNYLVFKDEEDFNLALKLVRESEFSVLKSWEQTNNFSSFNELYEKVVKEQTKYLRSLVGVLKVKPAKYPMCELLKTYRDNFLIDDNQGIDMKVTQDLYAYLVNANNLVKIGNQIFQYNYDNIKVIVNGDENQITNLSNIKSTQGNIYVIPVTKTSKIISVNGGRTEADLGFCDSNNGTFRIIAYIGEDNIDSTFPLWGAGGSFYHYQLYSSSIKLRSNEKILWWWNNYETTNLTSSGYIKINNGASSPIVDNAYNLPTYGSAMHTRQEYFFTYKHRPLVQQELPPLLFSYDYSSYHDTKGHGGCGCSIR